MINLVILAAGRGQRMRELGDDTPKWLLAVDGLPIAERQLAAVEQVQGMIRSVRVVVGHADSAVERFAADRRGIDFELIANPTYEELNNWYSLLLALNSLPADDTARTVIFNGDLLASPAWFASFLTDASETSSETLIGVDTARPLTDESMKVSARGEGEHVLLDRIGKIGVDRPVGEYVGVLMARGGARRALTEMLESFVGSDADADQWYEEAIGRTAQRGVPWVVWETPDSNWIEIDDADDYAAATRLAEHL